MVDMLEVHREALESPSSPYHDFLLDYKNKKFKLVYGFIEGPQDHSYYKPAINRLLPADWNIKLTHVNSKKNVIDIANRLASGGYPNERFPEKRICFFIDRDLSDFINEEFTLKKTFYLTDGYSIENDIVNFDLAINVIGQVYNISNLTDNEIEIIENLYDKSLIVFIDEMKILMAQIIFWRRNNHTCNLNNIKLNEIFHFECGTMSIKNNFTNKLSKIEYYARSAKSTIPNLEDISKIESEFPENQHFFKIIRGKYILWFMTEFIINIHKNISKLLRRFKKIPKYHITFSHGNAIMIVAPHARCSDNLKKFIETTYLEYIEDINTKRTYE